VVSFLVSERRADYGVRLALGAGPRDLIRLTLAEGIGDGLRGVFYGWVGSILLARLLSGLFFGVSAGDPWTLLGTATLMLLVVAMASWLPAMRATRVDPATVLRQA
jgi:ABC-type antimicrobial peptide transport system permease subunit